MTTPRGRSLSPALLAAEFEGLERRGFAEQERLEQVREVDGEGQRQPLWCPRGFRRTIGHSPVGRNEADRSGTLGPSGKRFDCLHRVDHGDFSSLFSARTASLLDSWGFSAVERAEEAPWGRKVSVGGCFLVGEPLGGGGLGGKRGLPPDLPRFRVA